MHNIVDKLIEYSINPTKTEYFDMMHSVIFPPFILLMLAFVLAISNYYVYPNQQFIMRMAAHHLQLQDPLFGTISKNPINMLLPSYISSLHEYPPV